MYILIFALITMFYAYIFKRLFLTILSGLSTKLLLLSIKQGEQVLFRTCTFEVKLLFML